MIIRLETRSLARFLAVAAVALLLLSLAAAVSRHVLGYNSILIKWFLFGQEQNVPTCYSALLFLVSAALAAVVALGRARARETYVAHWAALSVIFLYCSLDEMIEIHERFIKPFRALLHPKGVLYFAWIVPFAGLLLIFVLSYLGFLKRLPGRSRLLFVAAGAVYVLGAVGIEMLGGRYYSLHPGQSLAYSLHQNLEEILEIAGLSLCVYALCDYVKDRVGAVTFEIDGRAGGKPGPRS